jgi:hypothetical protein
LRSLALPLALLLVGCASRGAVGPGPEAPATVEISPPGPKLSFAYETLDGRVLSSASLAGRISVIGFATTYDLASQAQVRFLAGLLRSHTPRVNVALLILERPENRPLVEAFVSALRLPYPVALADAPTIAGDGPFVDLHHVPSVVILDAEGREVFRRIGLTTQDALEEILRKIERAYGSRQGR